MAEHDHIDVQDFELRRRLRRLAVEREPSSDLWPGIAQRLDHAAASGALPQANRRRPGWPTLTALAASLLAIAAMTGWWPAAMQEPAPVADIPIAAASESPGSRSLRIQAQAMTAEYQAALVELDTGQLPLPLQSAAAELERSAMQIREAMSRDPQSSFLLERLQDVYAQRLRLAQRGLPS